MDRGMRERSNEPENQSSDAAPPAAVSNATQTDQEDLVDGDVLVTGNALNASLRFDTPPSFFANFMKFARLDSSISPEALFGIHSRSISTQTEELDPISAKGQLLSSILIQDVGLGRDIPCSLKDRVYESLRSSVCEILEKHYFLFNGMVERFEVDRFEIFDVIANELFEAYENEQLRITWSRIVSLFAFAVRLVQKHHQSPPRVHAIMSFLVAYVVKHIVPFVRANGGWEELANEFPPPENEDANFKRMVLFSGLCLGLVASMYASTFLSK